MWLLKPHGAPFSPLDIFHFSLCNLFTLIFVILFIYYLIFVCWKWIVASLVLPPIPPARSTPVPHNTYSHTHIHIHTHPCPLLDVSPISHNIIRNSIMLCWLCVLIRNKFGNLESEIKFSVKTRTDCVSKLFCVLIKVKLTGGVTNSFIEVSCTK